MIDYFDDEKLNENYLKRVQDKNNPTIWYIYENEQTQSIPIKVIKEIPFEHVQMYRELQYEDNPNIVKVLDIVRLQDMYILEMEYVKGILIGEYIEDFWNMRRQSSPKERLEIVLQVCSALKTCHKLGIVHRDISEKNIILMDTSMINEDNKYSAVLIDFGNVHRVNPEAVKDTTTLGTIGYAAPEQLGYSVSDYTTDIYAVGILLCRMFTGMGREGIAKIENDILRNITKRCIRLDKNERYKDINLLMFDLMKVHKFYSERETNSEFRLIDFILQYIDRRYNIDYTNVFFEMPEKIKLPIFSAIMISVAISFVLSLFLTPVVLPVCYLLYSFFAGRYFRKKLERMRFFYPFHQNITEISDNLVKILNMNHLYYKELSDTQIRIDIEERTYIVELDTQNQTLQIAIKLFPNTDNMKLVRHMREEFGDIVFWFQHVYTW